MKKRLSVFLLLLCLLSAVPRPVWALDYSGEPGAGPGGSLTGSATAFCLLHADSGCGSNLISGYRFSVADPAGGQRGSCVDVYRDRYRHKACGPSCPYSGLVFWDSYGYSGYSLTDSAGRTQNKLSLKKSAEQGLPFSLRRGTAGRYRESALGFTGPLPGCETIGSWILDPVNAAQIVSLCLPGAELNYGDLVLIEPIFSCRVEGLCCGLTASDLARLGLSYYGDRVPGGVTGGYEFAWLSAWVYRGFPNMLSVTERNRARMLGLSPGTKLALKTKPSALLDGAYGMAMAIELSESLLPPELRPLCCEAKLCGETVQLSEGEDPPRLSAYLQKGKTYVLRFTFSEESSRYRVRRSFSSSAFRAVRLTNTDEPVTEIELTLGSDRTFLDIMVREDWIGEDGTVIQQGTEKVFRLLAQPVLQPSVSVLDLTGGELSCVYLGQRVQAVYRAENGGDEARELCLSGFFGEEADGSAAVSALLPDGAAELPGLRFRTVTEPELILSARAEWTSPSGNVVYSAERSVPVCIPDVAVTAIRFRDENGVFHDPAHLPADTELTPVLSLVNHTGTAVFAEVFFEGEPCGLIKLPARSVCEFDGPAFAAEAGAFACVGEIYLEGQERSAALESDPSNNRLEVRGKAVAAYSLKALGVDDWYYENTKVYSSAYFHNDSPADLRGGAVARFRVFGTDGRLLLTETKPFVCPRGERELLYFRWTVTADAAETVIDFSLDGGASYLRAPVCREELTVLPLPCSETPDTVYEAAAPDWFEAPEADFAVSSVSSDRAEATASWQEWRYDPAEGFSLRPCSLRLSGTAELYPQTGLSPRQDAGRWTVRSGYALGASVSLRLSRNTPEYTGIQLACALFPEFAYSGEEGCFTNLAGEAFSWRLEKHFMPLWYPDGDYAPVLLIGEFWTPVGRLTLRLAPSVGVEGSLYDDWYVGR